MKICVWLVSLCLTSNLWAGDELMISAASSLKGAFTELGKSFEHANKGSKVFFNFAASGQLKTQIEGGAPVDLFASASSVDTLSLKEKKLIDQEIIFAKNSLVLVTSQKSSLRLTDIQSLKLEQVKRIACGHPGSVPVGRYAKEVMDYYKLSEELKGKLIYGESVRQVVDYVARGEVDAGFVFLSDLKLEKELKEIAVFPSSTHSAILYPLVLLKNSQHKELAKKFLALVQSAEGKRVLASYGFKVD